MSFVFIINVSTKNSFRIDNLPCVWFSRVLICYCSPCICNLPITIYNLPIPKRTFMCGFCYTSKRERNKYIFVLKSSVIGRVVSCGAFQVSLIPFSVCSARRFSGATACDISTLSIRSAILFSGISSIA